MIYYRCKICGYEFKINRDRLLEMEIKREYIECPQDPGHKGIKKIDDYKSIMEERKAVEL